MAKSINDARFTMWATIIPRLVTPGQPVPVEGSNQGAYSITQDPDSGEVITYFDPKGQADYTKPPYNGSPYEIQCYARAYTALGYRSSANRETYIAGDYAQTESIQFDFPKNVILNHQTLVTNLRGSQHANPRDYFWLDGSTLQPTVWEVQGVSPVHDPFGKWIRNTTVLKRSEVQ